MPTACRRTRVRIRLEPRMLGTVARPGCPDLVASRHLMQSLRHSAPTRILCVVRDPPMDREVLARVDLHLARHEALPAAVEGEISFYALTPSARRSRPLSRR